jgi:cytochrome c oxidase cbb3-type subunit I
VISSAKVHSPDFLGLVLADLRPGFPAHINALVYGWGMQAAFAVIIWLMARLSRKECTHGRHHPHRRVTSGTSASPSA